MNKEQARDFVRQTFTQAFDKARFLDFTKNLVNHLDESKAAPMQVPNAFKAHIRSCTRLGTYRSPRGELADVLIVNTTEPEKIERTRTALRDFVAHKLKREEDYKEAGIVAFVSPDERNWRFSYIRMEYQSKRNPDTGKIVAEERVTPARRFSYIVGEGESCHTAQSRFLNLLQDTDHDPNLSDIEEAFSVEVVTKEFFTQYVKLFEKIDNALQRLTKRDKTVSDEFKARVITTVDFAKKLMGQIVFLYFLQKKGWLGVDKGKEWGTGPRSFLRQLVEQASSRSPSVNIFNDLLEPLFYDTLATDRGHEAWCKQFSCRIPFLNGGLFEPVANYDWQKTDIALPNQLFTNDEYIEVGVTGTGVLDVFDRYNFTVNEAEPLETEVAIDPEMLGKVFENLIEENRRKGLGAYYTPREIVHYMCQESLINYLDNALNVTQASSLNSSSSSNASSLPNTYGHDGLSTGFFDPFASVEISRRNLPHWRQGGVTYFVTFRLADSLPQEKLEQLRIEREKWLKTHHEPLSNADKQEYWRLFSKKVEDWLDAGIGSCVLRDPKVAKIVADALQHFDGERYKLGEWVVMPNHVHLLVTPKNGHELTDILHSWKSFTANEINELTGASGAFWQHESYDHIVRSQEELERIEQYIRDNPRKAGITVAQASSLAGTSASSLRHDHDHDGRSTGRATVPREDIETFVHLGEQISHYESVKTAYDIKMPKSIREKAKLIDEKLNDITVCDPAVGSGAFLVMMMVEIVRARLALTPYFTDVNERTPYHFKRHAILNSLYGVDIDAGAVEIAKLRLWLSLVVDEEDVKQIKPLPNLDYRVVEGNSLIGLPDDVLRDAQIESELERLRKKLGDETDNERKREYREEIKKRVQPLLDSAEHYAGYKVNFDFGLFFSEVFHGKDGFDIVLANPPYVQITKDRFPKHEIEAFKRFNVYCYKADLYELFLERTVYLLGLHGVASYITPVVWLTLQNCEPLRKLLLNKTSIIEIRVWGDGVFENAVVSTQTVFFTTNKFNPKIKIRTDSGDKWLALEQVRGSHELRIDFQGTDSEERLLRKIEDKCKTLGSLCEVSQGITPYDKYRGHDSKLISSRGFHSKKKVNKTYGPWIDGRDITRYKLFWRGEWLSYGDWLGAPREARFFTSDKLLCREVPGPGKRIQATFHSGTIYCGHAISPVIGRTEKQANLKFLLGLINSTLVSWYAGLRCPNFAKDVFPKLNPSDIKQIPVPIASSEKQKRVERLVDHILTTRRRNADADTSAIEREIDQLVYKLYGLTEEEIKIVEGKEDA